MNIEKIENIRILDTGELLVKVASGGQAEYKEIIEQAAGVYWDNELQGFKSNVLTEQWTHKEWLPFMIDTVRTGLNIELVVSNNTKWQVESK